MGDHCSILASDVIAVAAMSEMSGTGRRASANCSNAARASTVPDVFAPMVAAGWLASSRLVTHAGLVTPTAMKYVRSPICKNYVHALWVRSSNVKENVEGS
jgi:hypothetical protein